MSLNAGAGAEALIRGGKPSSRGVGLPKPRSAIPISPSRGGSRGGDSVLGLVPWASGPASLPSRTRRGTSRGRLAPSRGTLGRGPPSRGGGSRPTRRARLGRVGQRSMGEATLALAAVATTGSPSRHVATASTSKPPSPCGKNREASRLSRRGTASKRVMRGTRDAVRSYRTPPPRSGGRRPAAPIGHGTIYTVGL